MPTIGHLAVGMAGGRILAGHRRDPLPLMAVGAALACSPDLDLFGGLVGVLPDSMLDHRGAFHSLFVAALIALPMVLLARKWRLPKLRVGLWAFVLVASHGLLDILNARGKVALFWPFSTDFFTLPWQPIPGVQTTPELLTLKVLPVLLAETLIFAPFFLLAFWKLPWRTGRPAASAAPLNVGEEGAA